MIKQALVLRRFLIKTGFWTDLLVNRFVIFLGDFWCKVTKRETSPLIVFTKNKNVFLKKGGFLDFLQKVVIM